MRIKWLRSALRNLEEISSYISQDDPDAAERTIEKIVDATRMLPQHLAMGRAGRLPGTRELVVTDIPFIVPYRVCDQEVQIIRVIHGARRWPKSL